MQNEKIENQIEFLLSAALQKCGNLHDAEDLTQETLLTALSYMAKGNAIGHMRAWLLTVLDHKWNDFLRKKYRQPIVGIGEDFDLVDEDQTLLETEKHDEAAQVRQAVAYLARIYRDVIVRHYMNGESVSEISTALGIPEGTVKSRLHSGREQLKKGIEKMETYSKQSYQPITLHISNSGSNGRNGEPQSLIQNDLLAQNILWAAYEKPLPIEEIAKNIGTPTAYVESVVAKLVDGELIKQIGNKYYTDFMISTIAQRERYIPDQKQFVSTHFNLLWRSIDKGLEELRKQSFYRRCTFDEKNSMELYFVFHCVDHGTYGIFNEIYQAKQDFPLRKDGGRWIAFGCVYSNDKESKELLMHAYSGERWTIYEHFAKSKILRQHVYGADGFPDYAYYRSPDYDFLKESDNIDDIITRLLYLIHTGTAPESVGFNTEYLRAIPWLIKCKILREEDGKPRVNIPILNQVEFDQLCKIMTEMKQEILRDKELRDTFATFLKDKKQKIPAHLTSVPLQKQYWYANHAVLFAMLREAIKQGKLYDGNYDDDSNGVNQHPCPMFLVIE
ncbi:MAG: sigma-70 family RNA polymerase sigma factor [Clostridia bacterium]|nr:sigma-70 family RNA polymerase sigma factor [Clostridia bacterium]